MPHRSGGNFGKAELIHLESFEFSKSSRLRHRIAAQITISLLAAASLLLPPNAPAQAKPGVVGNAVIWTDPGDIRSRDLYWGIGSEKHQPQPPVTFEEEDRHGTYPKFDVRDAQGKKWRAKLGVEAQPEVVASRLLWAVGYFVNENYFLPQLHIDKLPPDLHRAKSLLRNGGEASKVRLQRRSGEKRTGNWDWDHNPFVGTREFNGLRVMMALLRNWDLYDLNNAVLEAESDPGRKIYEVSDVGTGFGGTGLRLRDKNCKNNLKLFQQGRLLSKVAPDFVDLTSPSHPTIWEFFDLPFYRVEYRAHHVSRHVPRADAKWIGSLLAQLSFDQIADAFRAGGYSPEEAKAFTEVVLARIHELTAL